MSKKKPPKKLEAEDSQKSQLTLKTVLSFSLFSVQKFCSKKGLEIAYLTPLTPQDNKILEQIVKTGKEYENISDIRYITYQDVLEFIQRLVTDVNCVMLPPYLKDTLSDALEELLELVKENQNLPIDVVAHMAKMKIMESMYILYTRDVLAMQKRQQLHDELTKLAQETDASDKKTKTKKGREKKSKKEKSKSTTKSKKSKKEKSKSTTKSKKSKKTSKKDATKSEEPSTVLISSEKKTETVEDYTEITLQDNEIVFDYNVDNHMQYIILSGFPSPQIFKEFSKLNVPISAIVEISAEESDQKNTENFILHLHQMINSPSIHNYLENTILMKFNPSTKDPSKEILEDLIAVVKEINYIKRQHFHYIKNLNLYDFGPEPRRLEAECLEKYNRILNRYPTELVNIPLIIDALIEEICWRELGPIYSLSDLSTESSQSNIPKEEEEKETTPYQAHEEDSIKMGLYSYREIGQKCYDRTLMYLKLLKPFEEISDFSSTTRFQDRVVTTEEECYCTNIKEMLDYFHLALFSQMKYQPFEPKPPEEYQFNKNLVNYNEEEEYESVQPRVIHTSSTSSAEMEEEEEDNEVFSNYHLKEEISTSVLCQLIFKAFLEYTRYERAYCEDSDAILLKFHDNLNEFGIETKLWNCPLRTPICLRDFCRFISIEDRAWLEERLLTKHAELAEDDNEEKCEGLRYINVPELYGEYQYLLEEPSSRIYEAKKQTFDQILEELLTYPRSEILYNFCAKPEEPGAFIAYDLGQKRVQVTGHTTTFHSDDGVKVTVDASRFLTEEPKCTISVNSGGNNLVFHSRDRSAFHMFLKDDTLIRISKVEEARKGAGMTPRRYKHESVVDFNIGGSTKVEQVMASESEAEPEETPIYEDHHSIQVLRKHKLSSVFPDFEKIKISDRLINVNSESLNALLEIFKIAISENHQIYKVSMKPSIRYLSRKSSPLSLPLSGVLRRVFFKPHKKKKKIRGYSVVVDRIDKKGSQRFKTTINLPHGLSITTLPNNKDLIELKQSYQYTKTDEEYRIFYISGVILIKNTDGTTTIYKSNGDIIELTDQSATYSTNCPKNMTSIFRRFAEDVCPYKLTRCESPASSSVSDIFALYEFGDIPYNTKTLLDFNGKKITWSEEKVSESQVYYVLNENDYHAEETFFKREDGMRCIINKKGVRTVQFPDGTKISAWPVIEKDLLYFSSSSKAEGWVSVTINYKFEHPSYISTEYDAIKKSSRIFLKDALVEIKEDSAMITVPEKKIAVEVSGDSLIFLKTCPKCDSDCICKIQLDQNQNKLLEVCDSYDKYLRCDYEGKCEINANYVKGPKNKKGCDHRWNHEKSHMFIINKKGPSPGTLLWKDGLIEEKIHSCEHLKNVKYSNYMNKVTKRQTMEFFTEIYQNFIGRFTMTQSYTNIYLSKFKNQEGDRNKLFYVTYRIVEALQDIFATTEASQDLIEFLETNKGRIPDNLLKGINELLEKIKKSEDAGEEERCSYRLNMKSPQVSTSSVNTVSDYSEEIVKVTVQEVIARWRDKCNIYRNLIKNKNFPCYFESDYYKEVMSTLDANKGVS